MKGRKSLLKFKTIFWPCWKEQETKVWLEYECFIKGILEKTRLSPPHSSIQHEFMLVPPKYQQITMRPSVGPMMLLDIAQFDLRFRADERGNLSYIERMKVMDSGSHTVLNDAFLEESLPHAGGLVPGLDNPTRTPDGQEPVHHLRSHEASPVSAGLLPPVPHEPRGPCQDQSPENPPCSRDLGRGDLGVFIIKEVGCNKGSTFWVQGRGITEKGSFRTFTGRARKSRSDEPLDSIKARTWAYSTFNVKYIHISGVQGQYYVCYSIQHGWTSRRSPHPYICLYLYLSAWTYQLHFHASSSKSSKIVTNKIHRMSVRSQNLTPFWKGDSFSYKISNYFMRF
jgi:hypothetical protein